MSEEHKRNDISDILWAMPYMSLKKNDQFTVDRIISFFADDQRKAKEKHFNDCMSAKKSGYDEGCAITKDKFNKKIDDLTLMEFAPMINEDFTRGCQAGAHDQLNSDKRSLRWKKV